MRKSIVYDRITIDFVSNTIEIVKRLIAFDDDDTEIGARYLPEVLKQGDDISAQPLKIRKLANALWT